MASSRPVAYRRRSRPTGLSTPRMKTDSVSDENETPPSSTVPSTLAEPKIAGGFVRRSLLGGSRSSGADAFDECLNTPVTKRRKSDAVGTISSNSGSHKRRKELSQSGGNGRKLKQMYLDLGQKNKHITCPSCGMVYIPGEAQDAATHKQYHETVDRGFPFKLSLHGMPTWEQSGDGDKPEMITAIPCAGHRLSPKIKHIVDFVDRQLGSTGQNSLVQGSKVYLYLVGKRVVGYLLAHPIQQAYRLLAQQTAPQHASKDQQSRPPLAESSPRPENTSPDLAIARDRPERASVGVSRIWVAGQFRRRQIATRLVNAARKSLVFAHVAKREQVAFSAPTDDGNVFARSYAGTSTFLVFINDGCSEPSTSSCL